MGGEGFGEVGGVSVEIVGTATDMPSLATQGQCICSYPGDLTLRPSTEQFSKAAFCKSAFAKSKLTFGKSAFTRSRFAFRQSIFASQKAMVWPSATSKMLSAKMC